MTYLYTHTDNRAFVCHGYSRCRAGFTLAEVMFAVLILGIGLISIASLFPAAGAIQRNTMSDVTGEFVASNVEAKLKTRGISESTLAAMGFTNNVVKNLTDAQLTSIGLPLAERVFPEAYDINRNGTANENVTEDNTYAKRQFYWRPLFMRDAQGNWKIFVFVQRRIGDGIGADGVPGTIDDVVNSGNANAGDWTVQTNGTLVRLTSDGSNGNWKGVLAGNSSTTVTVLTLSNGVIR